MQTPAPDRLSVIDAVVEVDATGIVTAVHDRSTPHGAVAARQACENAEERVDLDEQTRLLPGLVDMHIHAPQWPQLGTGLDLPLERWLFEYTFPLEARYADTEFASSVWDDLVPTLLAGGTTTAVYFSSNHLEATTALAQACARHGQRALVGRVAMDDPTGTPEWYRDATASAGVDASAASIEAVTDLASPLVEPIITPRFTPACTDAMLHGLGELAETTGVRVQTHCAESDWHCGYAFDRFGLTDAAALDGFGLMRARSVLAHADHLSVDDLSLVAQHRAGVAHCPLSNAYFANAVFGVRPALAANVGVGLGSDVSGGARPGCWGCARTRSPCPECWRTGSTGVSASERGVPSRIDTVTAFWLDCGRRRSAGPAVGHRARTPIRRHGGAHRPPRRGDTWDGIDDDARVFEKVVRLATARHQPGLGAGN